MHLKDFEGTRNKNVKSGLLEKQLKKIGLAVDQKKKKK